MQQHQEQGVASSSEGHYLLDAESVAKGLSFIKLLLALVVVFFLFVFGTVCPPPG